MSLEAHMRSVASLMRSEAERGVWNGRNDARWARYSYRCQRVDQDTATTIIFTRDVGHHTSGWWKNPDYERCWHLSLSAAPPRLILPGQQRAELNAATRDAWVRAFYGENTRIVWYEPAYSAVGKRNEVTHWRLFCDENWQPILPRGEVYSRELTEAGWKSASQVLAEERVARAKEVGQDP